MKLICKKLKITLNIVFIDAILKVFPMYFDQQ